MHTECHNHSQSRFAMAVILMLQTDGKHCMQITFETTKHSCMNAEDIPHHGYKAPSVLLFLQGGAGGWGVPVVVFIKNDRG